MLKRIPARTAGLLILLALAVMLIVHLLVLAKVVPYRFVWGGAIDGDAELTAFEGFAAATTVLFMALIAWRIGLLGRVRRRVAATAGAWIVFAYFLLNTVGNLASGVTLEKALFAPVTIVLTLLAYRVAIQNIREG